MTCARAYFYIFKNSGLKLHGSGSIQVNKI
uniref:Uncharacterized protein n=1 Tax=Rhizophora mucronata TaxID=61149 RepID=A0A2P2NC95_RHIMU